MIAVRRTTARIIFLTGLLFQGIYTVQADQPGTIKSQRGASKSSNAEILSIYPERLNETKLANAIDIKGSRPKSIKSLIKEASTKLQKNLTSLKGPKNLYLPQKITEVKITKLHPIKLDEVKHLAEVNNPQLQAINLQVDQAKYLLLAAISRWYPTVNLSANGLPEYFSSEQDRNPDFGSDTSGKYIRTAASIKVNWNLIDPARVPEIASARDTYEKAKNSYLLALRQLRLEALNRYFLLQRADEGVRIGKESLRASNLSVRDAKARFEAGVATRLEVLEAETQLARDKQLLTSKLRDQNINRRLLAGLLNLPPNVTPTAASPTQVIGSWESSLQESITSALKYREELNQHLLDISINNSKANSALAAIQPTLSIFNTFSASAYNGQSGIISPNKVDMDDYGSSTSNTVGINATWSIFDGGRAKALYKYNKKKAEESEYSFASTRNRIRQEVEESFYKLRTANQDISTTTREVIASREALRLARLRFQAGVTTQREVVNNQRDLTQAEVRYTDAITTYNTSLAQLERSTGVNHVKACKPQKLSGTKEEADEFSNLPIEPFPLIPACEASKINK